jgi:hypothetical protein
MWPELLHIILRCGTAAAASTAFFKIRGLSCGAAHHLWL